MRHLPLHIHALCVIPTFLIPRAGKSGKHFANLLRGLPSHPPTAHRRRQMAGALHRHARFSAAPRTVIDTQPAISGVG